MNAEQPIEAAPEVPVALNKKGKPIKVGHKDIDKRTIEKGDLFILARDKRAKILFRVFDKELADKTYDPGMGRWGGRNWWLRQSLDKTGHKRIVGSPTKMRPGCFGIVLGRHEQRPSQWHCIIGGRHYSVSNTTMRVLKTEEEFVKATHDVEKDNSNITPEEWVRVMRSSVEIR